MKQVPATTRQERRARRQQGLVAIWEAREVARLAGLDYKVSSESGALRMLTHSLTWHVGSRKNSHAPPSGRGWDRSGSAYLVGLTTPDSQSQTSTTDDGNLAQVG